MNDLRREWLAKNKDRLREYQKQYAAANKERIRAKKIEWRRNNPDKVRAHAKVNYRKNAERIKARAKRWYEANKETLLERGRAWRKKTHGWRAGEYLTDPLDKAALMSQYELGCSYCRSHIKLEVDHKVPKSRGGLNVLGNLQWLCYRCNRSKHTMTEDEFFSHVKNICLLRGLG